MMKYGAPTMVEMESLEQGAEVCRKLGLDFLELNINFPQYTLKALDPEKLKKLAEEKAKAEAEAKARQIKGE